MLDLHALIDDFFKQNQTLELYNEFSLQHELGIFLRNRLPDFKVQFERHISYFMKKSFIDYKDKFPKREIDIVIFGNDERYAIELKFPNNGQYPEQMFAFVKDIRFMETLKEYADFTQTACVVLACDALFYQAKSNNQTEVSGQKEPKSDGIYHYFRTLNASSPPILAGEIQKPTGDKCLSITLSGSYQIVWQDWQVADGKDFKYYKLII